MLRNLRLNESILFSDDNVVEPPDTFQNLGKKLGQGIDSTVAGVKTNFNDVSEFASDHPESAKNFAILAALLGGAGALAMRKQVNKFKQNNYSNM